MYPSNKHGQSVSARLRLGLVKMYLVGSPDHVNLLFKLTPAISSNLGPKLVVKTLLGILDHIVHYILETIQANEWNR